MLKRTSLFPIRSVGVCLNGAHKFRFCSNVTMCSYVHHTSVCSDCRVYCGTKTQSLKVTELWNSVSHQHEMRRVTFRVLTNLNGKLLEPRCKFKNRDRKKKRVTTKLKEKNFIVTENHGVTLMKNNRWQHSPANNGSQKRKMWSLSPKKNLT